jgi:hypothetical protein
MFMPVYAEVMNLHDPESFPTGRHQVLTMNHGADAALPDLRRYTRFDPEGGGMIHGNRNDIGKAADWKIHSKGVASFATRAGHSRVTYISAKLDAVTPVS